ncbi:putative RNA binding protein Tma22 [Rhodotorula diobovata]|uniref:Translation machinery-associated protein 22 n=1 Tax=Rhodotorula diobovata TaxID=5288 RepID=A0A5C5G2M3_9BASI|nr:putative RNA binding protein Tma22 [Rhodotorula diobovata]
MSSEAPVASTSKGPIEPQTVLYCAICSYPPEYCEFNSKKAKCKAWLESAHPDLHAKYYSESALEDKLANLTVEQRAALDKDLAKKEKKEEQKAEKEKAKQASAKIIVKRMERNKKKYVTSVHGLHHFNVDLKKAAKLFANKFGAGATVSKTPQGDEEILIQGDTSADVRLPPFLPSFPCARHRAVTHGASSAAYRQAMSSCAASLARPPSRAQVEEMLLNQEDKKLVAVFGGKISENQISLVIEQPKKKTAASEAAAAAALVPAQ